MENEIKCRNASLDLVRAISIFMVLITHSLFVFKVFIPKIEMFALVGNLSIDMFFALSGFLIGNIFIKKIIESEFTLKKVLEFLKNRFFKTLPTYYLTLLISLVVSYLMYGDFQDFNLLFLCFLQNIHEADFFFFPTSYSLAIEEWFYISFPLIFFTIYSIFKKSTKKQIFLYSVILYILFSTFFRFFKLIYYPNLHWDTAFRKSILTRLDGTAYGLVLSYLNSYYKNFIKKNVSFFLLIGCIGIVFSILSKMKVHNFLIYTVYFNFMPISIVLILAKFIYLPPFNSTFANILKQISISSYCFYLVHLQLVYIPLSTYWQAKNLTEAFLQCFCMYVLTVSLGYLLYRTVEVPMMKLKDKILLS